ncbi:hypothetical protein [Acidipila sp. EB88]|uniref:hypothetical protein n=1 Tax=Acidipila sp. EB88 TaxID=2305226 RepID=UPI000F5F9728|nr:hypothetical protein [Acidipila sp. EB88]RRA47970.1 hypothetical protein D1Y84_06390 [Acidipila sp. EB88]
MATSLHQTGTVIVGYFADGQSAHQAINALIDEGFVPSEIGAAFHVTETGAHRANTATRRQPSVGGSLREELGTTLPGSSRPSTTFGAPASDTTAVQPGALGGGSGTPFGGAGRPGPISGSSLANTGLPSELKSTLPHDGDVAAGASHTTETHRIYDTGTEATTGHTHEGGSWLDKLKHTFGHHSEHTAPKFKDSLTGEVAKDSKDFGTGEGDLHLNAPSPVGLRYSQPAFEQSFSGAGVAPGHARDFSHRLGHGGAIVTVQAAARTVEAERILENYGAELRPSTEASYDSAGDGLVEVFGTVHRDYPGYIK